MFRLVFIPCLLLAVINGLGAYLSSIVKLDFPWGLAVVISGIYVFFLLLHQQFDGIKEKATIESRLRSAIAGAIVVQYLILVGTVAFFDQGPQQLPPIAQTLVASFTSVVGIVIAFYFGASAYVEAKK